MARLWVRKWLYLPLSPSFEGQAVGGTLTYQFTSWCSRQVVRQCTSKYILGNQQKSSYFPLVSALFISFHSEVNRIENKYSEKREACLFVYINHLNIFWLSSCQPPGLRVTLKAHTTAWPRLPVIQPITSLANDPSLKVHQ